MMLLGTPCKSSVGKLQLISTVGEGLACCFTLYFHVAQNPLLLEEWWLVSPPCPRTCALYRGGAGVGKDAFPDSKTSGLASAVKVAPPGGAECRCGWPGLCEWFLGRVGVTFRRLRAQGGHREEVGRSFQVGGGVNVYGCCVSGDVCEERMVEISGHI